MGPKKANKNLTNVNVGQKLMFNGNRSVVDAFGFIFVGSILDFGF